MTLTVEQVPIESLRPYPGNPKQHDLAALRESVRLHGGQYRAVVISRDDVILAGHGTIEALAAEGHTQADVNRRPYKHTDPRARKIVLADNRLSERAGYDDRALAELLTRLEGDMEGTGYETADLDKLLSQLETPSLDPNPLDPSAGKQSSLEGYLTTDLRQIVVIMNAEAYLVITEALDRLKRDDDETWSKVIMRLILAAAE